MGRIKNFWRKLRYWQRGGLVGLSSGIFFTLSGVSGILKCGWNPAHSISSGIFCGNPYLWLIFYTPLLGATYLSWLLFGWADKFLQYTEFLTDFIFLIIIPSIVLLFSFFVAGVLIGFIIEKIEFINCRINQKFKK